MAIDFGRGTFVHTSFHQFSMQYPPRTSYFLKLMFLLIYMMVELTEDSTYCTYVYLLQRINLYSFLLNQSDA